MSFESPAISFVRCSASDYVVVFGFFLFVSLSVASIFAHGANSFKTYTMHTKALLFCALNMAIANLAFVFAVKFSGIALPVLIYASSPVACAVIDFLFYKRKTPKIVFITSFFIFIGLFIILSQDLELRSIKGFFLGFLSVICFAMLFTTLGAKKELDRFSSTALGGLIASALSLPFATLNFTKTDLIVIALIGLIITPISRVLLSYSLLYVSAATIGLMCILESVFAIFWGYLFLDQAITLKTILGGFIIIASMCVFTLKTAK